jgi:hypothetical protein
MDTTITENTYLDVLHRKYTPWKMLPKLAAPVSRARNVEKELVRLVAMNNHRQYGGTTISPTTAATAITKKSTSERRIT